MPPCWSFVLVALRRGTSRVGGLAARRANQVSLRRAPGLFAQTFLPLEPIPGRPFSLARALRFMWLQLWTAEAQRKANSPTASLWCFEETRWEPNETYSLRAPPGDVEPTETLFASRRDLAFNTHSKPLTLLSRMNRIDRVFQVASDAAGV